MNRKAMNMNRNVMNMNWDLKAWNALESAHADLGDIFSPRRAKKLPGLPKRIRQTRNKRLVWQLNSKSCSLENVRSLLQNHPVTQVKDDGLSFDWLTAYKENPLLEAIRCCLSTEIKQEIINHGLNVNQTFRLILSPLYMILARQNDVICRSDIKLLLENGADPNATCPMISPRITATNYFTCDSHNWNYVDYLPMIQLLLSHISTETKTDALQQLFLDALEYIVIRDKYTDDEKSGIKNAIEAVKLFIESGALPTLSMFSRSFKHYPIVKKAKPPSKLGLSFLKQLCELSIECIVLTEFKGGDCMEVYLQEMNYYPSKSDKSFEKLFVFIKLMWNCRFEECQKMQKDFLKNKRSLWESIHDWCTTELHLTNERIYEIMYKFSQDEYTKLRNGVCHTAKNTDWEDFYEYVWSLKQYSGNVYLFSPDIFELFTRYLSKEDVFNYIMAILPDTI